MSENKISMEDKAKLGELFATAIEKGELSESDMESIAGGLKIGKREFTKKQIAAGAGAIATALLGGYGVYRIGKGKGNAEGFAMGRVKGYGEGNYDGFKKGIDTGVMRSLGTGMSTLVPDIGQADADDAYDPYAEDPNAFE